MAINRKTWRRWSLPVALFAMVFCGTVPAQTDATRNYPTRSIRMLVGCFDYFDPPQQFVSYLYASDDGGFTWETILLPDPVLASQYTLIYFGLPASSRHGALLLGREIYSSTDDGRTWEHVKTVNWDGQFSFVDSLRGWAIASSSEGVALVRTVDGGRTWALIKPVIGP